MKRVGMLLCFAMFLSLGAARGQQSPSQQGSGEGEQTPGAAAGQKSTTREPRRGEGIVADNLDRVAATAEQILDVLNRDAGLMVELKRAIAQDAGESGQILEESDLSDGAVTERLREDLRTRVLATRLLQRYGYLLPKVNPDSELAAEHNLRMRARAQQLERASEPYDSNHAAPQTVIAVGAQPSAERPANQGRAARSPLVEVDGALDNSRPEMLAAPPDVHLDLVKAGGRPSMQTEPAEHAGYAVPVETLIPATGIPSAPASRPPRGVGTSAAEFVPVRMDRRPNPYADVPSLYDLYVQANAPSQKTERFGMEVFRNGTADPDILPMDLPVGPDYIVGPGDSLAINLWGGVSQRLLRAVDREGRLALPEAG
ncbi:MAG TPA: polysaccharide biosynthesis/export family protein, partial [Candidatus Acidoferrum sp.]